MDRRQIAARALQFPLTILWLEGVIRLTCVGALAGRGLAYTLLFGLSGGLACGVLACLWGPRGNRRAAFFLTGLLTVWYMAQAAYFRVFKTFLTLDTVTLARSAMTDYWPVALSGILGALPILALLAVPLLLLCLWERRGRRKGRRERSTRPSCFAHTPRALAACLLVSFASEHFFGVADITGAYLLGLFLSTHAIKKEVARKINVPSYLFFSPIFFASVGLKVELEGMTGTIIVFSFILLAVAILTKIIGCGLGAKICGFTAREALQVGVGMVSRGEVALIVAQKGYDMGLLDADLMPAVVLVVIATTIITPIILKKIM